MRLLSEAYPIEWGVLFGHSLGRRYNLCKNKLRLNDLYNRRLRLAAHLCGQYAHDFQAAKMDWLMQFERIQVNMKTLDYRLNTLEQRGLMYGRHIIIQHRATIGGFYGLVLQQVVDNSGGRGKVISNFPQPPRFCPTIGYAGGINPENIKTILNKAREAAGHIPFWLDMETGVRTDDHFDLDKCQSVCEQIWGKRL